MGRPAGVKKKDYTDPILTHVTLPTTQMGFDPLIRTLFENGLLAKLLESQ